MLRQIEGFSYILCKRETTILTHLMLVGVATSAQRAPHKCITGRKENPIHRNEWDFDNYNHQPRQP